MTSTDLPASGTAYEAMTEAERLAYWQRGQASRYAQALREGLDRLDRFAAGESEGEGDTFASAAGDLASTALWMLAEAQTDRLVYSHADPAWLEMADQIRAQADQARSHQ
jgi:hypothetical protein